MAGRLVDGDDGRRDAVLPDGSARPRPRRRGRPDRPGPRRPRSRRRWWPPSSPPWWRPTANLVQMLASTNWFGLNAPAIMDIEAAYEQMWALDVSAMFGYYTDAAEAVSQLAPWRDVLQGAGFHVTPHGQVSVGTTPTGNPEHPSTPSTSVTSSGSGLNLGVGNSET